MKFLSLKESTFYGNLRKYTCYASSTLLEISSAKEIIKGFANFQYPIHYFLEPGCKLIYIITKNPT